MNEKHEKVNHQFLEALHGANHMYRGKMRI